MKVSDITSRVLVVLNDGDAVRWTYPELIKWISDAEKMVAIVRPDASVANGPITLVAGTRQALPAGSFRLLDVIRNLESDGSTGGRAIRYVDRYILDSQNPNWHRDTQSGTIKNFVYDNRNPLNFYTYPPAIAGTKVEAMYSVTPAALTWDGTNNTTIATSLDQNLTISDLYMEAVVNYVLFRAYSKDAEFSQNSQLATGYLQTVFSILGIKTQKDVAFSPDLNAKGALPNPAALQSGGV